MLFFGAGRIASLLYPALSGGERALLISLIRATAFAAPAVAGTDILAACLAGLGVLYLAAVPYMYLILNLYLGREMPLWDVVRTGMLLYLPGDGVKIAVTCLVSRPLVRALNRA